ncbi:hypothetical protein EDEG_01200 [Edhazardia aedis USNM 41457]|uniref:AAA domain-containing protein n=1 Tax=Edhazardia aedis (strain USNM 41457) TaxID=1003232 RepID=J9DA63_EDHAE|nr:hypothetical protein EDEG_01200 [Edhazardia aedis USNM 41457]|eukprot:EJW04616.1 hypothetical protein EDEG_01200 [Edhazardia aedis USNM 41457]
MRTYAIMSAKGGVGKSSIAALVSLVIQENKKVLLLDFDISGPSQKTIFPSTEKVIKTEKGLKPVKITENLYLLTIASLIDEGSAVIWRGPKKQSLLQLFYGSITETNCDFVIIDMPPGLTEEHNFLVGKDVNAIFVTSPQQLALNDTKIGVDWCLTKKINVFSLIENLSGFYCEKCGTESKIFGTKGGELLANDCGINFMCALGIESKLCEYIENGTLKNDYVKLKSYQILKTHLESLFSKNNLDKLDIKNCLESDN